MRNYKHYLNLAMTLPIYSHHLVGLFFQIISTKLIDRMGEPTLVATDHSYTVGKRCQDFTQSLL